jgi:pentatricopeptide repeat protein
VDNNLPAEAISVFYKMVRLGVKPNDVTFICAFKACAMLSDLSTGTEVHKYFKQSGLTPSVALCNSILNMYRKCLCVTEMSKLFNQMRANHTANQTSWNIAISAYQECGQAKMALNLFEEMHLPNEFTYVAALSACKDLCDMEKGKHLHSQLMKSPYRHNEHINSSLLSLYAKCGSLDDASATFRNMSAECLRGVSVWNSMMSVYSNHNRLDNVILLFKEMLSTVRPDDFSCTQAVSACAKLNILDTKIGDYVVNNALKLPRASEQLIHLYMAFNKADAAISLFTNLQNHGVKMATPTWTTVISVLRTQGKPKEALQLFKAMSSVGIELDSVAYMHAILACSDIADIKTGSSIHNELLLKGMSRTVPLHSAVLLLYAKCGMLFAMEQYFEQIRRSKETDTYAWNIVLKAYRDQGEATKVLELFKEMEMENISQDSITYISALSACADVASLSTGKWLHERLKSSQISMTPELQGALINMYAKCGAVEAAKEQFALLQPSSNIHVSLWNTMLSCFAVNGMGRDTLNLFKQMLECQVKPDEVTILNVLMGCCHSHMVEEALQLFNEMESKHNIKPTESHYNCMVDVFSRAGHLDRAENFVREISTRPTLRMWKTLLAACSVP